MMTTAPRTEQHTTCPQPHEQLLVGWLVGGTTTGRPWEHGHNQPLRHANKTTQRDDNNNNSGSRGWTTWPRDPDNTHQDNASWTTCLQDKGEKVDYHPIARGVERGCYVSGTGVRGGHDTPRVDISVSMFLCFLVFLSLPLSLSLS